MINKYLLGIEVDEKTMTQLLLMARDADVTPEYLASEMVVATVILNQPTSVAETPEEISSILKVELERRGFSDG